MTRTCGRSCSRSAPQRRRQGRALPPSRCASCFRLVLFSLVKGVHAGLAVQASGAGTGPEECLWEQVTALGNPKLLERVSAGLSAITNLFSQFDLNHDDVVTREEFSMVSSPAPSRTQLSALSSSALTICIYLNIHRHPMLCICTSKQLVLPAPVTEMLHRTAARITASCTGHARVSQTEAPYGKGLPMQSSHRRPCQHQDIAGAGESQYL